MKTKKSCHKQDPFQNINPNITLEIKSFSFRKLRFIMLNHLLQSFLNTLNQYTE